MEEQIYKQFSVEIKSTIEDEQNDSLIVDSYISTYGIDYGKDIIMPGAFTESIKSKLERKKNLPALWQHDQQILLGHAVDIKEDENGILVKTKLPKSHWRVKQEIIPLLKNGSLTDMSIGFGLKQGDYEYNEETNVRIIKKANIFEYSFVSIGMNPDATIEGFKSILKSTESLSDIEDLLKKITGKSNSDVKALISKIKEFSKPRDEVKKEDQREAEQTKDFSSVIEEINKYKLQKKIELICQQKMKL